MRKRIFSIIVGAALAMCSFSVLANTERIMTAAPPGLLIDLAAISELEQAAIMTAAALPAAVVEVSEMEPAIILQSLSSFNALQALFLTLFAMAAYQARSTKPARRMANLTTGFKQQIISKYRTLFETAWFGFSGEKAT